MKKWLVILGIITCMAGLTACGANTQEAENIMPAQEAQNWGRNFAEVLDNIAVVAHGESDYVTYVAIQQIGMDADILQNAVDSWMSASEDMGNYVETVEVVENSMEYEMYNEVPYPMNGTISVRIKGSKHDAIMELVFEEGMPTSISTNVEYTFGESMAKAALNTLLGMGTVFVVLILISFIISAFGVIPKLTEKKSKPEEKKADAVVSQIAEREELSDDTELVAVISAAIAAYEGSGSTDGFVVRSIRRTRSI